MSNLLEQIWNSYTNIYEPGLQIYITLIIIWILYRYIILCLGISRIFRIKGFKTILEVCILNLTAVLTLPAIIIGFIIFYTIRLSVNQYLKWKYNGKVWLMPGSDAVWGTESYANACNFTSLYVIKGKCDLEEIRNKILYGVVEKIINGEKIYEKLKWLAGRKLTHSVWERIDNFDIKNHVRLIGDNNDNTIISNNYELQQIKYTETQVFDEISKFYDYPLPKNKPQWETLVIPNYIYNDQEKRIDNYYGLIFKIHHSIMDGVSAGFLLQHALADSPPKLTIDPLAPLKLTLLQKIISYTFMIIFGLHEAVSSFTLFETNCFHGPPLTGPKKLDWSKQINLDALKHMKNTTKSSTTAVLVSAMGASLRSLAMKKILKIPPTITSATTVAILPYSNMKPQNRFTVVLLPMEIELETTTERILSTHREALILARSSGPLVNFYLMRLLGETPAWFCELFMRLLHATMLMSNVPGPSEKVTLFGGHELVDVAFWTPLRNHIGVSMSIFSYAGQLRISMVGDSAVFSDKSDISTLITEFENEIIATGKLSGVESKNCFTMNNNNISSSSSSS